MAAGGKDLPLISDAAKGLLVKASPSTIDRLLRKEKEKQRVKGLTKPGPLLKHQIPVRVCFSWDERKPGFFELDTVSHCGIRSSEEFCVTLTLTDGYSGWTEVRALRNRAHRWVKEQIAAVRGGLPFPLLALTATTAESLSTSGCSPGLKNRASSSPGAGRTGKTTVALWNRNWKLRFRRGCGEKGGRVFPV
ncbi:MAG: hypothetical protein LBG24_07420 [Treponema sp.]|nr:hypothetical protein [Treponema sp.]